MPSFVAVRGMVLGSSLLLLFAGVVAAVAHDGAPAGVSLSAGGGAPSASGGAAETSEATTAVPLLEAPVVIGPAEVATTSMQAPARPPRAEAPPASTTQPPRRSSAFRAGSDCRGIYLLDPDTTGATKVADAPRSLHGPTWSPDGAVLAWGELSSRVVVARPGEGARTAASGAVNNTPVWFGDHRRVVWSRYVGTAETSFEAVVTDVVTGDERVIPTQKADAVLSASPLGGHVVYGAAADNRLRIVASDGSGDVALPGRSYRAPVWMPGTDTVTFADADGQALLAYDAGTGTTERIYGGPVDGEYVFAGRSRLLITRPAGIEVIDLPTGAVTATIRGGRRAVWDEDRGMVIFQRLTKEPYSQTLEVRPDGSGERVLIEDAGAQVGDVQPAPRGGRLAFHCSLVMSR